MKLSLVLTTLLLSSTALANTFDIECFDEANSKLFTINSTRPASSSIIWADGSSNKVDYTKTESVKSGGCMQDHTLKLEFEHAYQPSDFKVEIVSYWSYGKPMTRCARTGFHALFEGSLSKEGKTIAITCKDMKGTEL